MIDKTTFMETLRSVQEIAETSQAPLSREEIQSYFGEMELSLEQQEMIYEYLMHPKQETAEQEKKEPAKKGKAGDGGNKKHSRPFQMYLNEIRGIPVLSEKERQALYQRLLAGEKEAAAQISNQWLKRIAEIAESYTTGRALLEDLVQEGNMGLLLGMERLTKEQEEAGPEDDKTEEMSSLEVAEKRLELFVRAAMESYCQETESADYNENTILAKVNLIHEAQKILAEENGTIPTQQELSQYTRIPVKEIGDILSLASKD